MAEAQALSDTDLEHAVQQVFIGYPPLMHDRHRVHVAVSDGHVTLRGHVKSAVTRDYLVRQTRLVPGVRTVDASALYDDDTIRREAGRAVPHGIFVTVEYGAVVLSGRLPAGETLEGLVQRVGQTPGVHRVLTNVQ